MRGGFVSLVRIYCGLISKSEQLSVASSGETWQRCKGGVDAIVWKCAVRLSFVSSAGREDLIVLVVLRMLV